MDNPLLSEQPLRSSISDQNPNFFMDDFDSSLPVPPLDPLFLSNDEEDFNFDDHCDFDITFDDLDQLYFPSENEEFLIPNAELDSGSFDGCIISDPAISGSPAVHAGCGSDVAKYLNSLSSKSGICNSSDQNSDSGRVDVKISSPVSSQGSGNGGPEVMNALSPESGDFVVDQKVKVEVATAKNSVPKRKKEETSEDTSGETRNQKYRRSENINPNNANSQCDLSEEEEKKRARLVRNRESAQLSRQRKKHYVEELEEKVRTMHSTISELNGKISFMMAENASLRQQLNGNGMCPPPMYPPMGPVPYPWVPCAPYVVKPQGSKVPLVPIPRLKPQQPVSAPKAKKVETKKTEGKTKKVASVSFLGLLFFILLFGGLVPVVDVKFGFKENSTNGLGFSSERFYGQHMGKVLVVNGQSNGSHENSGSFSGKPHISPPVHCRRGGSRCSEYEVDGKGRVAHSNASEPLFASLYVPRNDKLVKIDGNLIIHSVLASERAMASRETPQNNNKRQTGLAIPSDFSSALAIPDVGSNRARHAHMYRPPSERQKAITSGSTDTLKDHLKSSAADGKLQQWFREGLAGPMLSSGMCTEVFQFDTSPTPGAIIPASSVANVTKENRQNATNLNKGKNRRTLRGLPVPLAGPDLNITRKNVGTKSPNDSFQGNKSASPMVVSVLVDPREAGDSDGMITPKSLSRVFVVVLLDSVKYVTYSCGLPHLGPHLVTA